MDSKIYYCVPFKKKNNNKKNKTKKKTKKTATRNNKKKTDVIRVLDKTDIQIKNIFSYFHKDICCWYPLTLVMLNKLGCHATSNCQPIRLLDPGDINSNT